MTPVSIDLLALTVAAAGAIGVAIVVRISSLLGWKPARSRLRSLTGNRQQRVALRTALAPVLREFLPLLEKAGQEVRAIVLVPTLSGNDGEPLLAEVEQVNGSAVFIVRLAHRVGGTVRQAEDLAGTLAEELLYLYRHAAAVTVVRQTPASSGLDVAMQSTPARRPVGRIGLATLPRHAAQNEAEETVVPFRASPLGSRNNQGS
jgi:hypothetical protein